MHAATLVQEVKASRQLKAYVYHLVQRQRPAVSSRMSAQSEVDGECFVAMFAIKPPSCLPSHRNLSTTLQV